VATIVESNAFLMIAIPERIHLRSGNANYPHFNWLQTIAVPI